MPVCGATHIMHSPIRYCARISWISASHHQKSACRDQYECNRLMPRRILRLCIHVYIHLGEVHDISCGIRCQLTSPHRTNMQNMPELASSGSWNINAEAPELHSTLTLTMCVVSQRFANWSLYYTTLCRVKTKCMINTTDKSLRRVS